MEEGFSCSLPTAPSASLSVTLPGASLDSVTAPSVSSPRRDRFRRQLERTHHIVLQMTGRYSAFGNRSGGCRSVSQLGALDRAVLESFSTHRAVSHMSARNALSRQMAGIDRSIGESLGRYRAVRQMIGTDGFRHQIVKADAAGSQIVIRNRSFPQLLGPTAFSASLDRCTAPSVKWAAVTD